MRKKSREEGDADDSSSSILSLLPDEMILQILKKVKDLKSLCCCYLVSKYFSSIVLEVDAISVINPRIQIPDKNIVGDVTPSRPIDSFINDDSFLNSVFMFLNKFKGVKSLIIEIPSSSSEIGGIDNSCLFKWMVNFGSRIKSFYFLSPNSIERDELNVNGNGDEEEEDIHMRLNYDLLKQKYHISFEYLKDVMVKHKMLLFFIKYLPKLENASITASGRSGGRLSLSGETLSQVKKSEFVINCCEVPGRVSQCFIPILTLPVSGYVMKGAYLVVVDVKDQRGGNDFLINNEDGFQNKEEAAYDFLINNEDGFQDKEEAAYTEAVMQILEKHKSRMR